MQQLHLISPIPASVNAYLKPRPFIKNGMACVTMYETAEAKNYKACLRAQIKKECVKQGFKASTDKKQHFYMDCTFYFGRVNQDANNYFKLLCDAITESRCVWVDDNVCCERVNAVYYDASNPRIELTIYPVDYIGVFQNQDDLTQFSDNCTQCSRYRDGRCSILCKATDGYIQEQVILENTVTHCTAFKQSKKKG